MTRPRTKIGLIVPSSNTTVEPDFQRVVPPGVTLHAARMWLVDTTPDGLEAMNEEAETAARALGSAAVDVVAYACTSGSFLGGPGYDEVLLAKIEGVAGGAPAVGTSPAVVEALRASGIRRVAVVTPYVDSINERLRTFLEAHGLEVSSMAGQQLVANLDIGKQTPDQVLRFANVHLFKEADGFFLSCTNWRAMEVAEPLEQALGKPVVTSNQATIWAAFRAVGLTDAVAGYGRLLRSIAPARAGA